MATEVKLKKLVINDLTEEQFKETVPNENELYLTQATDFNKEITIELHRDDSNEISRPNSNLGVKNLIWVVLHNFTAADIGKKICVYKTVRQGNRGFKKAKKWGYGSVQNLQCGNIQYSQASGLSGFIHFPAVPSWMPNNGFIKTEYELTADIISKGRIVIDFAYEWLPLICWKPNEENNQDDDSWNRILGVGGMYDGLMRIKFGLEENDRLVNLSSSTLCLGVQNQKGVSNSCLFTKLNYSEIVIINVVKLHVSIK